MFASVFAAPAAASLGRGGLQPRQQFGDRLTTGLWLVGIRERIGVAIDKKAFEPFKRVK